MAVFVRAAVLAALLPSFLASQEESRENPIRKVVTFLQNLSKELESDGERDKELFDKYQCYCSTQEAALAKSIEDATARTDALTAEIEELNASNGQLEQEISDLEEDLAENRKGMSEANDVREKEASEFATESGEMKSTLQALEEAIPALQRGLGEAPEVLAQLTQRLTATSYSGRSQSLIQALVQQTSAEQTGVGAPSSSQILGVLQQMKDDFTEDLAKATEAENERVSSYQALGEAKSSEVASAVEQRDEKKTRVADARVRLATAEADLTACKASLATDQEFKNQLMEACKLRSKEYQARTKDRLAEQDGISQVIKILNDDESLELFKNTLTTEQGATPPPVPGLAFVQTGMSSRMQLRAKLGSKALAKLRQGVMVHGRHAQELSMLEDRARQGMSAGKFDEVTKMINGMVDTLKEEQVDDDHHLSFCKKDMQKNADELSRAGAVVDNLKKQLESMNRELKDVQQAKALLQEQIAASDTEMMAATATRKSQHADYSTNMSQIEIALRLLRKAKDILAKMYLPKQEEPKPVYLQEDAEEPQRPYEPPPAYLQEGDLSFVQVRAKQSVIDQFLQMTVQETDKAPETATYEKKTSAGGGAISMLDQLVQELQLSKQEAEKDEEEAQKDYENMARDASASRTAKTESIEDYMTEEARLAEELSIHKGKLSDDEKELQSLNDKKSALHLSCDFLVNSYDVRKKARAEELESLQSSLAVLAGADGAGFGAEPVEPALNQMNDVGGFLSP